jgi:hypothetical protein
MSFDRFDRVVASSFFASAVLWEKRGPRLAGITVQSKGGSIDMRYSSKQQLVASFGAAQAGGAMKCADGRGAFLVVNRFTCFLM